MSWLGFLNFFLFQWFFIRLTYCKTKVIEDFTLTEISLTMGGYAVGGYSKKTHTYYWYSIQKWILPLTGWYGNFVYLNKRKRFLKITKPQKL
jgi:hypothetical protein